MQAKSLKVKVAFGAMLVLMLMSGLGRACDVPVFRYALERWPVDPYHLVVVADTPLTAEEKKVIAALKKTSFGGVGALNLNVLQLTRKQIAKSHYKGRIPALKKGEKNRFTLFYPRSSRILRPIWSGIISKQSADKLVSSTVRKKIIAEILGGTSGVFVFLESGNKAKDKKALAVLNKSLAKMKKTFALSKEVVDTDSEEKPADPSNKLMSAIPFKVEFSVVTLPRKNGDEILMKCLLGLEEDLAGIKDEPIVFSVYGRGRALEPLVGKGINEEILDQIAGFFCGPCSCQVKAQNPGTDLLLLQDWDTAVFGGDE